MEAKMSLFEKKIGDSVWVTLGRYGRFLATLQKIEGDSFTFMFDDCITKGSINQEDTNNGGYEESYMERFLSTDVYNAFPEGIRCCIKSVTLATAGQIFGHDNEWCNKYLIMDKEEQFPLMEKRQNRIACFDDDTCWWWLQNPVKKKHSSASFATVSHGGNTLFNAASNSYGVRPVFTLVRPISGGLVPQPEEEKSLYPKIIMKEREIASLKLEINHLKKIKQYDDAANEMKAMMDSYIRAGFTKEQAFRLILELFVAAIGGMRR